MASLLTNFNVIKYWHEHVLVSEIEKTYYSRNSSYDDNLTTVFTWRSSSIIYKVFTCDFNLSAWLHWLGRQCDVIDVKNFMKFWGTCFKFWLRPWKPNWNFDIYFCVILTVFTKLLFLERRLGARLYPHLILRFSQDFITSSDSKSLVVVMSTSAEIFKFTYWRDLYISVNCWISAKINIILTTNKHATKIREVSFAVGCQTNIVKCDYAAKEKFEVKITVLPFSCILIKKVYW